MHLKIKSIKPIIFAISIVIGITSPITVMAEEIGPGISMASKGTEVDSSTGAPSTVTDVKISSSLDLDAVVASAGLDELGEGNTPPDSILGVTPFIFYDLRDQSGELLIDGISSIPNNYLYLKDGFSKLKLEFQGVGRYYYRVYSATDGWSVWCTAPQITPTNNYGSKIQAIQIRVKGYTYTLSDLYYKVVLNDGTVLDWAKDGQTTGTIGTDKYIVAIKLALWNKQNTFIAATDTLMEATSYEGTYLATDGSIQYSTYDGSAYTGWGYYGNTAYYFINGSRVSGWQNIDSYKYYFNDDGSLCKDVESVMALPGSYKLRYNKATRTMYVMAADENNNYIIPYKTFMTSCGPDTPLGVFNTYAKYNWKLMHDDIYCQFLTRFKGSFLMHSLLYYNSPDSYSFDAINYNYIDDAVSGGCIRLRAGDAAWIYNNCPLNTEITVYVDEWDKGPVEKDAIEQVIPRDQTYDPTDPLIVAKQNEDAAAQAITDAAAQAAAELSVSKAASDDAAEGITFTE